MFHGKPLYVSIAQRKEDRKAQLQLQHAQRIAGLTGSPAAVIPSAYPPVYYPPMSPRQSLYYQPFGVRSGWRPNSFLAPRPAFQSMPLPGVSACLFFICFLNKCLLTSRWKKKGYLDYLNVVNLFSSSTHKYTWKNLFVDAKHS